MTVGRRAELIPSATSSVKNGRQISRYRGSPKNAGLTRPSKAHTPNGNTRLTTANARLHEEKSGPSAPIHPSAIELKVSTIAEAVFWKTGAPDRNGTIFATVLTCNRSAQSNCP